MKSRVHPKYGTKCRVGNWAEYDRALVRKGDITLWIATDATDAWKPEPSGRRGGQVLPLRGSTVQSDEVHQQRKFSDEAPPKLCFVASPDRDHGSEVGATPPPFTRQRHADPWQNSLASAETYAGF